MNARGLLEAARNVLEMIQACSPDPMAKSMAAAGLARLEAIAEEPSRDALRMRALRASRAGPNSSEQFATVQNSSNGSRGGKGGDLSQISLNGEGECREGEVVTNSSNKSRPARKTPATHCPGVDETPEAVDAWCRTQGIPPASQSPQVRAMLLWHQAKGQPQASWKARLRACKWGDERESGRYPARPEPPAPKPRTRRTDGKRCELHGADACSCPDWRLTDPAPKPAALGGLLKLPAQK